MKIEIKSWFTGGVLFSLETDSLKLAIEAAVKSKTNLWDANLWGANLRGANLRDADLRGANLWGANLRGANLRGADLWGANLRGANLRDADLRGANLRDANLRDADLWGAKNLTHYPIQILGHRHYLQTTNDGRLQIGCHIKTFEEWEAQAEEVGKAEGYSAFDIELYKLHISHISKVASLLWAHNNAEQEVAAKA